MGLEITVQASKDYLRINKFDSANAVKRINGLIASEKILQRAAKEIAELIAKSITDNIRKGRRFDTGGKVAPLKKSTIKRKGHSKVFYQTGKLDKGAIVKKNGRMYRVMMPAGRYKGGQTIEEVAGYLQDGRKDMKARPFFGINKKNLNKIVKQVLGKTRSIGK